jgi:hypothetical protein
MEQLMPSEVFSLPVPCPPRPNAGRIFLVMALGINVVMIFVVPNLIVALCQEAAAGNGYVATCLEVSR